MKKYLILHSNPDNSGIEPYVVKRNNVLDLYIGKGIDLMINGTKSEELLLCETKDSDKVYTVVVKTLPSKDLIEARLQDISLFTHDLFWALKIFVWKSKFVQISKIAREQHGPDQEKHWHNVIGLSEPIFCGGWL